MTETAKKHRIRYTNPTAAIPGWHVVFVCEHGSIIFTPIAQWMQIEYLEEDDEGKFLVENTTYSTEPMIVEGFSLVPLCTHEDYPMCIGISAPGEEKEAGTWLELARHKLHELHSEETSTEVKAN